MRARNRVCENCGKVEFTASKSKICQDCYMEKRRKENIAKDTMFLEDLGFRDVEAMPPTGSHTRYKMIAPCCGNEVRTLVNNIKESMKRRPGMIPCAVCGASRRMQHAHAAFVEKYGWHNYPDIAFEKYVLYRAVCTRIAY